MCNSQKCTEADDKHVNHSTNIRYLLSYTMLIVICLHNFPLQINIANTTCSIYVRRKMKSCRDIYIDESARTSIISKANISKMLGIFLF